MPKNPKPDQSFDSIAKKFDSNIYGSTKGKLRHQLLVYHLTKHIDFKNKTLKVLDAGGGTGVMTETLLQYDCNITLNDISAETLALAKQRLPKDASVKYSLQSVQDLPEGECYDVIICHAVLEWLSSPLEVIDQLLTKLNPKGYLSLSFFNRDAHIFGNLLYGNFDYVKAGMKRKNTVRLNPNNSLKPSTVLDYLSEFPIKVIHQAGIRCFHDYLKQPDMQTSHYQQLFEMEKRYSDQSPFMWLGKYFHVIVQLD
jgi:S-adenosylmethionine-dependent methyltransferase